MSEMQRLTDRKRLAIIDAAIEEFRVNGFEATSMDRIAATAGVSKRTVYNHFPSKNDLFAEIMVRLWDRSMTQHLVAYSPTRPLRVQLMEMLMLNISVLNDANFLDLARVAIAETIHSPERASAMVARLNEKDEGVANWIRAAQQDGKLKPADPQFAATLLQSPVKTFAFWPQVTLDLPLLDAAMQQKVLDTAVDMFLAYFGQPSPQPGR
jgi:TetR/AcrR family transcriptional regulator of autoinduction and epiphytic fitness